jgi:5-methyltetrahydropteroyltriglutamate--homocysteine methyltransferase
MEAYHIDHFGSVDGIVRRSSEEVWKDVTLPAGKVLMPGLIAHSTNLVEHPDLVAERLLRYADIVGRDNVMAGTDCGFSQSPLWAKLKCLAEGAAIASKLLWH